MDSSNWTVTNTYSGVMNYYRNTVAQQMTLSKYQRQSLNISASNVKFGNWAMNNSGSIKIQIEDPISEPATEQESIPILAQRFAGLRHVKNGIEFASVISRNGTFSVDEDAECKKDTSQFANHSAPHWNCTCGFYAVPADKLFGFTYMYSSLILQVELSGRVIIHDSGYRAEHQKVLEVKVPSCRACGNPSVALTFHEGYLLCDKHNFLDGVNRGIVLKDAEEALKVPFTYTEG